MNATSSRDWLAALARLGPADLRRISRLVDLLTTAPRAAKATADIMLDAAPYPETHQEARARIDAVTAYLAEARSCEREGAR